MNKVRYEDLTEDQLKIVDVNGCGGKGGVVKPPYRIFFKTSCNFHDYSYWCGGNKTDRKEADQGLYKAMVKDCSGLPIQRWLRYRPWCWLYYIGVRICGGRFFYYADQKRYPV